jgi:hypothetical protein
VPDVADVIVNHSMDNVIVGTAILAALVYFGVLLVALRRAVGQICKRLCKPLSNDPPEFDPKSSSAASLTAVTSVLGAILGNKLLPAYSQTSPNATTTHLPSADTYVYLNVFFIALLGLALLFYFSLGRRLGVYLIADALIFWGAFGVVFSFDLALLELTKFSALSRAVLAILVTLALVAITWSRITSTITLLRARATLGVAQLLPQGQRWQVK